MNLLKITKPLQIISVQRQIYISSQAVAVMTDPGPGLNVIAKNSLRRQKKNGLLCHASVV